ncbi:MAG: hypothetical protein ACHQ7M_18760 [Chloroflexota bacterium]
MHELLRWLDIIPGRNWLILGAGAAALAELVRAGSQTTGVTVAEDTLLFGTSTFDVAIVVAAPLTEALLDELRRTVWPAGTVAAYASGEPAVLESTFRAAGLHAVQACTLAGRAAARGTR